jgi:hypothetical protein
MNTTFATAALSDIKSFLAANTAEAGLASAMKFDGWKVADVRAYADRVQALRDAGFTAAITPRTVAAAEQQVADECAAAEAAVVAAEAATAAELMAQVEAQVASVSPKKGAVVVASDTHVAMLEAAAARAMREGEMLVLTSAVLMECGWSPAYSRNRCNWGRTMRGGLAAVAAGYEVSTRTDKTQAGGFVVVLRRAA